MTTSNRWYTSVALLSLLFLAACGGDSGLGPDGDNFDRRAMLVHWADEIIVPSFASFEDDATALDAAAADFSESPTQTTLDELRAAWEEAYLGFQWVSMYHTGPAMNFTSGATFRTFINTYPTDRDEIHDSVESGEWNLELPSLMDAQGLPALDYLLYGVDESDTDLLTRYQSGPDAADWRRYLTDVATRIHTLAETVGNEWQNEYRDTFVENDGAGANASVDRMVNDFIFDYEKYLRAGKVGIPAGILPGAGFNTGTKLPGHVEAPYRGDLSRDLLMEALTAAERFFRGQAFQESTTGPSLEDYLDYINDLREESRLSLQILDQFEKARQEILELDEDLKVQVEQENSLMLEAYDALQRNVVYLKTDMLQDLYISVNYTDADGD